MATITAVNKVAGIKVYPRQTWNFRSHEVSACIGLWCHGLMHGPHRLMHACTAFIAPWCHRPMHAVTAWALLFWFHLGYTFNLQLLWAVKSFIVQKMANIMVNPISGGCTIGRTTGKWSQVQGFESSLCWHHNTSFLRMGPVSWSVFHRQAFLPQ
jgi:hypothetical protein